VPGDLDVRVKGPRSGVEKQERRQQFANWPHELLEKRTIPAFAQPLESARTGKDYRVDVPNARLVYLSYFGAVAKPAHVRYQIRRFRRVLPKPKFLACTWMLGGDAAKLDEWKTAVGADFVATSLTQAAEICAQELRETGGGTIHLLRSVGTAWWFSKSR
jgi:hypothetical protein